MLPNINCVVTLGKDIKLTYLSDGTAIAKMVIAFSDKVKKKGEWVDETLWMNATYFGKHAEYITGNTQKGDVIEVRGVLRANEWTDKEGNKHRDINLLVDGARTFKKSTPKQTQQQQSAPAKQVTQEFPEIDVDDSEIPFNEA